MNIKSKQSLLEKAKSIKTKNAKKYSNFNHEDIELALAWVRDDVSLTQVMSVYGVSGSIIYYRLAVSLKKHLLGNKK